MPYCVAKGSRHVPESNQMQILSGISVGVQAVTVVGGPCLVIVASIEERGAEPQGGADPLLRWRGHQDAQLWRQQQQALRREQRRYRRGPGQIIASFLVGAPQGLPGHL